MPAKAWKELIELLYIHISSTCLHYFRCTPESLNEIDVRCELNVINLFVSRQYYQVKILSTILQTSLMQLMSVYVQPCTWLLVSACFQQPTYCIIALHATRRQHDQFMFKCMHIHTLQNNNKFKPFTFDHCNKCKTIQVACSEPVLIFCAAVWCADAFLFWHNYFDGITLSLPY